jgi:hypothetical protein
MDAFIVKYGGVIDSLSAYELKNNAPSKTTRLTNLHASDLMIYLINIFGGKDD